MQKQTSETANATYTTQDKLSETHNNDSNLAENIPLGESGLVIRRRGNEWFTTIGDTIITDKSNTKEEQLRQLDEEIYSVCTKITIHVFKTLLNQMSLKQAAALKAEFYKKTGL